MAGFKKELDVSGFKDDLKNEVKDMISEALGAMRSELVKGEQQAAKEVDKSIDKVVKETKKKVINSKKALDTTLKQLHDKKSNKYNIPIEIEVQAKVKGGSDRIFREDFTAITENINGATKELEALQSRLKSITNLGSNKVNIELNVNDSSMEEAVKKKVSKYNVKDTKVDNIIKNQASIDINTEHETTQRLKDIISQRERYIAHLNELNNSVSGFNIKNNNTKTEIEGQLNLLIEGKVTSMLVKACDEAISKIDSSVKPKFNNANDVKIGKTILNLHESVEELYHDYINDNVRAVEEWMKAAYKGEDFKLKVDKYNPSNNPVLNKNPKYKKNTEFNEEYIDKLLEISEKDIANNLTKFVDKVTTYITDKSAGLKAKPPLRTDGIKKLMGIIAKYSAYNEIPLEQLMEQPGEIKGKNGKVKGNFTQDSLDMIREYMKVDDFKKLFDEAYKRSERIRIAEKREAENKKNNQTEQNKKWSVETNDKDGGVNDTSKIRSLEDEEAKLKDIEKQQKANEQAYEMLKKKKENYGKYQLGKEDVAVYDSDKLKGASNALKGFNHELEKRNKFQEKFKELMGIAQDYFVGDYAISGFDTMEKYLYVNSPLEKLSKLNAKVEEQGSVKGLQDISGKGIPTKKINTMFEDAARIMMNEGRNIIMGRDKGELVTERVFARIEAESIALAQQQQKLYDAWQAQNILIGKLKEAEVDEFRNNLKNDEKVKREGADNNSKPNPTPQPQVNPPSTPKPLPNPSDSSEDVGNVKDKTNAINDQNKVIKENNNLIKEGNNLKIANKDERNMMSDIFVDLKKYQEFYTALKSETDDSVKAAIQRDIDEYMDLAKVMLPQLNEIIPKINFDEPIDKSNIYKLLGFDYEGTRATLKPSKSLPNTPDKGATETLINDQNKLQQELDETGDKVEKIVYHYGNLKEVGKGKAELFSSMIKNHNLGIKDGGEPWGAMGTGTYFTSNANDFSNINRDETKYFYSLDISKLKMYETQTTEHAKGLFEYLTKLQQYCISFKSGYDYGGTFDITKFNKKNLYEDYTKLFNEVNLSFDDFSKFINDMFAVVEKAKIKPDGSMNGMANVNVGKDNIATRFMKLLGYDGINNTGTSYDSLQHGSTIFDLDKSNIVARELDYKKLTQTPEPKVSSENVNNIKAETKAIEEQTEVVNKNTEAVKKNTDASKENANEGKANVEPPKEVPPPKVEAQGNKGNQGFSDPSGNIKIKQLHDLRTKSAYLESVTENGIPKVDALTDMDKRVQMVHSILAAYSQTSKELDTVKSSTNRAIGSKVPELTVLLEELAIKFKQSIAIGDSTKDSVMKMFDITEDDYNIAPTGVKEQFDAIIQRKIDTLIKSSPAALAQYHKSPMEFDFENIYSGILPEIKNIKSKSEEVFKVYDIINSTKYVNNLKHYLKTITEANSGRPSKYGNDVGVALRNLPELEPFKDSKSVSDGEFNKFLSGLDKAKPYLESIGYKAQEVVEEQKKLNEELEKTENNIKDINNIKNKESDVPKIKEQVEAQKQLNEELEETNKLKGKSISETVKNVVETSKDVVLPTQAAKPPERGFAGKIEVSDKFDTSDESLKLLNDKISEFEDKVVSLTGEVEKLEAATNNYKTAKGRYDGEYKNSDFVKMIKQEFKRGNLEIAAVLYDNLKKRHPDSKFDKSKLGDDFNNNYDTYLARGKATQQILNEEAKSSFAPYAATMNKLDSAKLTLSHLKQQLRDLTNKKNLQLNDENIINTLDIDNTSKAWNEATKSLKEYQSALSVNNNLISAKSKLEEASDEEIEKLNEGDGYFNTLMSVIDNIDLTSNKMDEAKLKIIESLKQYIKLGGKDRFETDIDELNKEIKLLYDSPITLPETTAKPPKKPWTSPTVQQVEPPKKEEPKIVETVLPTPISEPAKQPDVKPDIKEEVNNINAKEEAVKRVVSAEERELEIRGIINDLSEKDLKARISAAQTSILENKKNAESQKELLPFLKERYNLLVSQREEEERLAKVKSEEEAAAKSAAEAKEKAAKEEAESKAKALESEKKLEEFKKSVNELDEKQLKTKIKTAQNAINGNKKTADRHKQELPILKERYELLVAEREEQERLAEAEKLKRIERAKTEADERKNNRISSDGSIKEPEKWDKITDTSEDYNTDPLTTNKTSTKDTDTDVRKVVESWVAIRDEDGQLTGEMEMHTVSITKDFKKRTDAIKKESDKVQNILSTKNKFLAAFNNKTAGHGSELNGYKELSDFVPTKSSDVDKVANMMSNLEAEYNKVLLDFRKGSASLNPFVNAINSGDKMQNTIENIALDLRKLDNPPEELVQSVKELDTLFKNLEGITDIYEYAKAFGELKLSINNTSDSIKLYSKEQKLISDEYKKNMDEIKKLEDETSKLNDLQSKHEFGKGNVEYDNRIELQNKRITETAKTATKALEDIQEAAFSGKIDEDKYNKAFEKFTNAKKGSEKSQADYADKKSTFDNEQRLKKEKEAADQLKKSLTELVSAYSALAQDSKGKRSITFLEDVEQIKTARQFFADTREEALRLGVSLEEVSKLENNALKDIGNSIGRSGAKIFDDYIAEIDKLENKLRDSGKLTQKSFNELEHLRMAVERIQNGKNLENFNGIQNYLEKLNYFGSRLKGTLSDIEDVSKFDSIGKDIDFFDNMKYKSSAFKSVLEDLKSEWKSFQELQSKGGSKDIIDQTQVDLIKKAEKSLAILYKEATGKGDIVPSTIGKVAGVKDLEKAMMDYAASLGYANKIGETSGRESDKQSASFKNQKGEVLRLTATINGYKNAMNLVSTEQKGAAGLMGNLNNAMKSSVNHFAMYFSAYQVISKVFQQLRHGVTILKEYDHALTTISYTMDLSAKDLQGLGKSAIDMANDLNTSVQSAMSIYQIYANMKTSMTEIAETAKPTAILSNLSGVSANEAADQVQGILNQFNMLEDGAGTVAEKSMHVVDVLDKISSNVAIDYAKGIKVITDAVQASGQAAYDAGM